MMHVKISMTGFRAAYLLKRLPTVAVAITSMDPRHYNSKTESLFILVQQDTSMKSSRWLIINQARSTISIIAPM